MEWKNYIFDFEEVVADLTDCYKSAFSTAFRQFNIPYDEGSIEEYIATPIDKLFGRYYTGCTCKYRDFVIMFMGAFDRAFPEGSRLRPGIRETVERLHSEGKRLGILSDSYEMYVRMLLSKNGIEGCFSSVTSVEKMPVPRPEAFCILSCLREMGAEKDGTVLIGTSERNRLTAEKGDIGYCASIE